MTYKDYKIENNSFSMKVIKPVGRGSVHKTLRGMYTSEREARKAIETFLANKGANDGEASSSS